MPSFSDYYEAYQLPSERLRQAAIRELKRQTDQQKRARYTEKIMERRSLHIHPRNLSRNLSICSYRKRVSMTEPELARRLGVETKAICAIEAGYPVTAALRSKVTVGLRSLWNSPHLQAADIAEFALAGIN